MAHPADNSADPKMRRRALWSSYLGSAIEYYDFLLYGIAAALVFPTVFFSLDPKVATLASFATLAVGYVARPLGAIFFGHYGDRIGRKKMLMMTLYLMGAASFLMGVLPSHAQVGIAAPLALIALRLVQGFAVGGEWAGATLLSMEHAGKRSRGFAASIVGSGAPTGAVMATLVLMPFAAMDEAAFLSWGWRVPFLLSALLVALAVYMRRSVEETPDFVAMMEARKQERGRKPQIPLLVVFRAYPRELVNGVLGSLACLAMTTLAATFMVNYAINVAGHARSEALGLLTIVNILHIFTIPAFAILSDRVGRRPVMLTGVIAGIVLIFPIFWLIDTGSPLALLLALALANPLIHALMGGPISAWMGEKFAADIRYSGMAVTFQLGSTLSAGFAPLIATWLLMSGGGSDPSGVAIFYIALSVISAIAILRAPESFRKTLDLTTPPRDAEPEQQPAPAPAAG
ncbi:MFS transporter [Sphingomonas canadensis]|uniref:MFS transporter n=1 Tax=Sphingomonas canadensis TaxID=1219257 RepID=A0ABW3H767_9SPHN|nr:MFS transporter [Sphingomonas canadensis]MCW3837015.1 MHS family MFS transporter [Sphingomonas canadensis]